MFPGGFTVSVTNGRLFQTVPATGAAAPKPPPAGGLIVRVAGAEALSCRFTKYASPVVLAFKGETDNRVARIAMRPKPDEVISWFPFIKANAV